MKNEYKLIVFLSVLSLCFILISMMCLYDSSLSIYYVNQVGIYNEEANKDEKIKELKDKGIDGYFYKKGDIFYVLSKISQDYKEIENHQKDVKGIIKTYHLKEGLNHDEVINELKGV